MRRPYIYIFLIVLIFSYIFTSVDFKDKKFESEIITIKGVVTEKTIKDKRTEYKIANYLVSDYSMKSNLKIGKIVEIEGKYKSLYILSRGNFDYARNIKSRGYKALINLKSYKVVGENKFYISIGNLKSYIKETIRFLYKKDSNFINSLLISDKSDLTDEEREMLSRTGTSHIIAISGLHIGIICSFIIFIIKDINKISKLTLVVMILASYAIIIGASPSIVRAIGFVLLSYFGIFIDKKKDYISILAFLATLIIILNSYIIYNVSFQLSFLATLSIIYFERYLIKIVKFKFISLTLSANILTLPIIYYTFGGISLITVVANIVIVPFISVILVLAFFSLIIFLISINVAKILAYINIALINNIFYVLDKLSEWKYSYFEFENPKMSVVVIYYVIVFSLMIYLEIKEMEEQSCELKGYL
ncbi:MAG: ComEC/Rec2 family competence protein [Clostridioides sp.]|jgi:competence protein ComEC|nr:ComEC/Rec2 family competence protein [Clostridioides sp.]